MNLFETLADATKPMSNISKMNRILLDELKQANEIERLKSIRDGFLKDQDEDRMHPEDQEIVNEINAFLSC